MAYAAPLHKLGPFDSFGQAVLEFLGDPTPYMPPSRLRWSRLLRRPVMDMEDDDDEFEVQVLRGELIRFGDTPIQCTWRRNENAMPTVARCPARAAPRHAWCVAVLSTRQDGDFFEAWRRRYRNDWPLVRVRRAGIVVARVTVETESVHPQLYKHCRRHATFADAWRALEACYVGPPELQTISQILGRNVATNVQRDGALQQLRDMVREDYPSSAWAI